MVLKMAQPYPHPKTGVFYFRQRIPSDLVKVVGREVEKISLRTKDRAEARQRFLAHASMVQERWRILRSGYTSLSFTDYTAIAGHFYRAHVARYRAGRISPFGLFHPAITRFVEDSSNRDPSTHADFTLTYGKEIQTFLDERGMLLDADSRRVLDYKIAQAMRQAEEQAGRYLEGDFSPDPLADRFPPIEEVKPASAIVSLSIIESFETYAEKSKLAPSTRKRWRPVFGNLVAFVGHDDVHLLTRQSLTDWRDDLAKTRSDVTVKDVYLASLKAVLNWLVDEGKLSANPAVGVKVKVKKAEKNRSKSLSDSEARTILSAALLPYPRLERAHSAARRWVPWICAYTGARVNEITQLRRQDIRKKGDIWYFRITPEAGTVKSGEFRNVPIHPHLVEQGFLEFVGSRGPQEMFYNPRARPVKDDPHPPFKKIAERLAAWVRELGVTDEDVSPSHGWRHRYKTEGREYDANPLVLDAIQGHAAASEGTKYGEFSLAVMLREMLKMPRYEICAGAKIS